MLTRLKEHKLLTAPYDTLTSKITRKSSRKREKAKQTPTQTTRLSRDIAPEGRLQRTLSFDSPGKKTKTKDQLQSPFFMIPIELRIRIYEMVLCSTGQVHIIAGPNRLYGRTCLAPGRICAQPTRCLVDSNLLFTCRRIYRESIDILYSGNGFIFISRREFVLFKEAVLHHRLERIKRVSIMHNTFGRPRFEPFRLDM